MQGRLSVFIVDCDVPWPAGGPVVPSRTSVKLVETTCQPTSKHASTQLEPSGSAPVDIGLTAVEYATFSKNLRRRRVTVGEGHLILRSFPLVITLTTPFLLI
jgi:hypothetical protein